MTVTAPATLFIVGTRLTEDACHYPDIDLHYTRRNGLRTFATEGRHSLSRLAQGDPEMTDFTMTTDADGVATITWDVRPSR